MALRALHPPEKPQCFDPRNPIIVESEADSWSALVDQTIRKNLRVAFTLHGRRALSAQISDIVPLLWRLAYLRMHHSALWDLMRCDVDFSMLSCLRVDVVCEDTADTSQPMTVRIFEAARRRRSKVDFQLRCPGLATVALLWHARAPEGPVMLDIDSILILGRALMTDAKPVLELGDVDSERPLVLSDASEDGSAALMNGFAAVRRVPCAFGVLLDQFDGDGWNDNAAVVEEKYLSQSLPW